MCWDTVASLYTVFEYVWQFIAKDSEGNTVATHNWSLVLQYELAIRKKAYADVHERIGQDTMPTQQAVGDYDYVGGDSPFMDAASVGGFSVTLPGSGSLFLVTWGSSVTLGFLTFLRNCYRPSCVGISLR